MTTARYAKNTQLQAKADQAASDAFYKTLAVYLAAGVPEEEARECAQFAAGLAYDAALDS